MESITWRQPATWKRFGVVSQEDAEVQALFAFNQGFYNLFLAIGTAVGIVCVAKDCDQVGWALIFFGCGCMVGAAKILFFSTKNVQAAAIQGIFPAAAIVLGILSLV